MEQATLVDQAKQLAAQAAELAERVGQLAVQPEAAAAAESATHGGGFLALFTVFVLACFVGFYVVWSVTPALH